jgi:hypothetical protein
MHGEIMKKLDQSPLVRLRDRPVGPLRRLHSNDYSVGNAFLEAASAIITPDDLTQRQAFEGYMPNLFVLRNKGCSWAQMAKLLGEAGLVLQMSTVRTYYGEALAARQDICQQRMNEQILLMVEIKKITSGADVAGIGSRVDAILGKQRTQVTSKLDTTFGSADGPVSPAISSVSPQISTAVPTSTVDVPLAVMPKIENKKTGLRPAPQSQVTSPPVRVDNAIPIAAVNPVVPHKTASQNETTPLVNLNLRCCALPAGVVSLKLREGMPKEFYLPGDLEHTSVPGVMLSLEQRLSSVALEFMNTQDGEIRIETQDEKRFRVMWRKPIRITESRTSHEFTQIDESSFE